MSPAEIIEQCKVRILVVLPFFGIPLLKLPVVRKDSVNTFATDYRHIFYNEEYLLSLSQPEVAWALVHECFHVIEKHHQRRKERQPVRWNIACDYAIHTIMTDYVDAVKANDISLTTNNRSIDIDKIIKMNPNWLYDVKYTNMSAEEIYQTLPENPMDKLMQQLASGQFDQHDEWDSDNKNMGATTGEEQDGSTKYNEHDWDATVVAAIQKASEKMAGKLPAGIERMLKRITKPTVNWRVLLNDFLQFEVNDYSFNPPDTRFQGDCIIPAYNDMDAQNCKGIYFFIDSSGSISEDMLNRFYSEIIGIIETFDYLQGYLAFFDVDMTPPQPFETMEDLVQIKAKGFGGTDPGCCFKWVKDNEPDDIAAIVILTDGEFYYPDKREVPDVPLLWIYSYEQREAPPYGVYSHLTDD